MDRRKRDGESEAGVTHTVGDSECYRSRHCEVNGFCDYAFNGSIFESCIQRFLLHKLPSDRPAKRADR